MSIEIGYISKAEEILDKELGITIDNLEKESLFAWKERLKHYYSLGTYHLLNSDYKDARKYFEHALEVGNNYFDLLCKLSQGEEDKEKREKDERNIESFWQINRFLRGGKKSCDR